MNKLDMQYKKVTLTCLDDTTKEFNINTAEEAKSGELEKITGFVLHVITNDDEGIEMNSVTQTVNSWGIYSAIGLMCNKIIEARGLEYFLEEGIRTIESCIADNNAEFKKIISTIDSEEGDIDNGQN